MKETIMKTELNSSIICYTCDKRFEDPCDPCKITGTIFRKGWKAKKQEEEKNGTRTS